VHAWLPIIDCTLGRSKRLQCIPQLPWVTETMIDSINTASKAESAPGRKSILR
jgi:hypothetical protein